MVSCRLSHSLFAYFIALFSTTQSSSNGYCDDNGMGQRKQHSLLKVRTARCVRLRIYMRCPTKNKQQGVNQMVFEPAIRCPSRGFVKIETMPARSCQHFYECTNCHAIIKPKPGDCCVFCPCAPPLPSKPKDGHTGLILSPYGTNPSPPNASTM